MKRPAGQIKSKSIKKDMNNALSMRKVTRRDRTHVKPLKDLLKSVPKKWEMKKFFIRKEASGDVYVLKKIFTQNKYLSLWRKHSQAGDLAGKRVLDIGANIGAFTVRALADQAIVVAVEPDPQNFALLQKNAPSATLVHGAIVGTRQRLVHMFSKPKLGQPNRNSVIKDHVNTVELPVTVPALRLKSMLSLHGPFDLVKIDIEGAEVALVEQLQAEFERSGNNAFDGTELLIYFHVDKFPEVRIFHRFVKQLREMFSVIHMEPVVGEKKMIDSDWEKKVVRDPGLRFRKLPGVAAAKKDILIFCGHTPD